MARAVEWSLDPTTSRFLWVARTAARAVFGGFLLLLLVGTVVFAASAARSGDWQLIAALAVLVVGVGPFALLRLRLMTAHGGDPPVDLWPSDPSIPRAAALAVAGATALVGSALLHPRGPVAVVVATFALVVAAAFLGTEGAVDPDRGTLTYGPRTVALEDLDGVHRATVSDVAVLWLAYEPGSAGFGKPRIVVLPAEAADRARDAFRAGVAAEREEREHEPNRLAQAILVGFALMLFAAAAAVVTVGAIPAALATYAVAFLGVFGLAFLWVATKYA